MRLKLSVAAVVLLTASALHADTFSFYNDIGGGSSVPFDGASMTGNLTTDPTGLVTSISGTLSLYVGPTPSTPVPILGLLSVTGYPGSNVGSIDNVLEESSCWYDQSLTCYGPDGLGIGIKLGDGLQARLSTEPEGYNRLDLSNGESFGPGSINFQLTSSPPTDVTPEPSTIALLSTGLLGAASLLRRRSRGSTPLERLQP